jgi:hypothetical protein
MRPLHFDPIPVGYIEISGSSEELLLEITEPRDDEYKYKWTTYDGDTFKVSATLYSLLTEIDGNRDAGIKEKFTPKRRFIKSYEIKGEKIKIDITSNLRRTNLFIRIPNKNADKALELAEAMSDALRKKFDANVTACCRESPGTMMRLN